MLGLMQNEIDAQNRAQIAQDIIGLILFIGASSLFLLIGWFPYIGSTRREIKKLRGLLGTLPVAVIMKTKKLKDFFAHAIFKPKS